VSISVVHISTSDIEGGSARSAWRIHSGLLARDLRSRMLVGWKSSASAEVAEIAEARWLRRLDNLASRITGRIGLQYCAIPSSLGLPGHPWLADADIIQLYNLHGGYFDLAALPALARRAPIVWRLSDLWPLTGHCAYPGSCERWRIGCGQCPDLATYPAIGLDFTRFLASRKRRLYRRIARMTIVAPSSWTESQARAAPALAGFPVLRIPNGIDTLRFRPQDRGAARARLGIADDRPAILFNAHIAFDNPRKGTDMLLAILRALPDPERFCLIVAGRDSEKWRGQTPLATYPLGYVTEEARLADLYAACDLVALPSGVENLPNTALEALASGRPMIAFDIGGMRDAVRDGESGFCVPAGDRDAFGAALTGLGRDAALRSRLAHGARALAEREFAHAIEIDRFARLYAELGSRSAP
jgi:glycosyltransferase involved in cell wall biosynthesis